VIVSQGNESSIFQENLVVCLCVNRRSWILKFFYLLLNSTHAHTFTKPKYLQV
jgi:hypothetical protein